MAIKILKIGTRSLIRIYNQDGGRICFMKDTCLNLKINHHDHIRMAIGDDPEHTIFICKHPDGFSVTGNGQTYCFAKCANLMPLTGLKIDYMHEYELIRRPDVDKEIDGEAYALKLYKVYKSKKGMKK